MNLLQIAQRAKSESGRSGSGPLTVTAVTGDDLRIVNACKDAWRELQMMPRRWAWMRTEVTKPLTIDTVTHTLAGMGITDWAEWKRDSEDYHPSVYDTTAPDSEWPLRFIPYEKFRFMFLIGAHAAGAPQYWSSDPDGSLLIGPKPDLATYEVRIAYFKAPTELAADGDTPDMPSRFHMLLTWMALMQISASDAATEHYQRASDSQRLVFDQLVESQAEPITFGYRPLA